MSTKRTVTIAAGLIAGCFAAGALAGCVASRSMSAAGDYGLHYVDMGERAKLAYGPANADAVGLMLECAKGSKQVELSDLSRGAPALTLISDGKRSKLKAEVQPGPDAELIYATASSNAPALVGFRQTARIDVENGRTRYTMTAKAGEETAVASFFAACEAA